jgi:tetratricopeptide (TPR) repeat protein
MLTTDYSPKITDFGLAKQLDEAGGQTCSGAIMGTPSYMAPEQAEGRIKDIGPRTDVYALGAILYELLTGRPPFNGATALDTLVLVKTEEPVPPRRLQPRISRDLETICLKCLRKEADKRYISAEALAQDLDRFLEDKPILARPVPVWERTLKWARRRPAQAALIVTVALALLGAVGGTLVYQEQQTTALSRRLELRERVERLWVQGQEAETAGRPADAKEHWDEAHTIVAADPEAATDDVRRRIEEGLGRVGPRLKEQATRQDLLAAQQEFQGRLTRFGRHRDQVLFHAVNFRPSNAAADLVSIRREAPAALAQLGLASGERSEEFGANLAVYRRLVESPRQLEQLAAECFQVLLVWAEAEAAAPPGPGAGGPVAGPRTALRLLDAAAALGKVHGLGTPRMFHALRAQCLESLGDQPQARAERERSATAASSALDYFQVALASYRQRQFGQVTASCEEALQQEPGHFWAQYLKALCNGQAKRWGEAKVGLTACLARNPECPWPLQLRGTAHVELKEFSAAEADFERALAGADDDAFRAAVLISRSVLRIRQGRLADAEHDLGQASKLQPDAYQSYTVLARSYQRRAALPFFVVSPSAPLVVLAQACQHQANLDAAVQVMDRALARRPDDPDLSYTRAWLHAERGNAKAARCDFEQTIAREPPGSKSGRRASAHVELAHLRHQAGEYQAALADCDAALAARPDYAFAHRRRAHSLVALGKYLEAGQALDRYLASGSREPRDYQARGLIHFRLREYGPAVEAFTQALLLKPDAETLSYRGWAYLAPEAARPALADFEEAIQHDGENTDARCGRAMAQVMLGQVVQADKDAQEALRKGRSTRELLLNGARIYARALALAEVTRDRLVSAKAAHYEARALELLRAALTKVPEAERAAFWRETVLRDPALLLHRRSAGMLQLARSYGR